jgi:hypothetical protein
MSTLNLLPLFIGFVKCLEYKDGWDFDVKCVLLFGYIFADAKILFRYLF